MTHAANDVARPAKRRRRKITDPEDYFLPPKLPAAKDVAMRIRGTDQAGRAYARRLAALGLIHCETPAWIKARDLFLGAVDAINVSSYWHGDPRRRPDRHSWRIAQRQDPYSAPPELAY